MARENEADRRPRATASGGQAVQSGTALNQICHYFIANVATATSMTFRLLDGTSVALGVIPVGLFIFDFQSDLVTIGTPANATVTAFYHIGG